MLENDPELPCSHTRTERRVMNSEYFKRQFLAEVDVCKDCGAQLWTPVTQQKFQQWVLQLKHERRDTFQIQFYLPFTARQNLGEFLKRFPGVPMAALIRAMTTVYLSALTRQPEFQDISKNVIESGAYRTVMSGVRTKTSVQFSPMAMIDLQAWSGVLKLAPHKIVEDAVFKILALMDETDATAREFWERNLLPHIELILRAL